MDKMDDGQLEEIRVTSAKDFFEHEEEHFTPWLKENIHKLADDSLLSFEPENVRREVTIEGYQADLVAQDPYDGRTVIIENQFGRADSDHFGRALMYAANEDADIVVWIAGHIEEAYANTIQMLNNRTDDTFGIYGIEVELIRLGESPPYGVNFTPIVTPDNFQQVASELSETDRTQQQFWEEFRDTLRTNDLDQFASRSARPSASYHVTVRGVGDTYIRPTTNYNENRLHVLIRVYDDDVVGHDETEAAFRDFLTQGVSELDVEMVQNPAESVVFEKTPDNNFDKINLDYPGENVDFYERDNWGEYHQWLVDVTHVFNYALQRPWVKHFG